MHFVSRGFFAAVLVVSAAATFVACSLTPQQKAARFIKRGDELLKRKDYERAALEFRNAAAARPGDAEPYYKLGVAYLGSGTSSGAIVAFQKALECDPKHAGAQTKLASMMIVSASPEVVRAGADKLRSVIGSADSADASTLLAMAEWRLGSSDDALRRLEDTLKRFPSSLDSAVALARLRVNRGDVTGARTVLEKAAAASPNSSQAALALGQMQALCGDVAAAEREIRRAIALDPQSGAALLNLALLEASTNRRDAAEVSLRKLAALPDRHFRAIHAMFVYRANRSEEAINELRTIVKADPEDRKVRNLLFAIYADAHRYGEAEAMVAAALSRNKRDIDALLLRSQLSLMRGGILTEAEADLKQVLHYKPDSIEAHLTLAAVYYRQKQRASGRQELLEALRLDPTLLPARVRLARDFTVSGEAPAALAVLDEAPAVQKRALAFVIERNWALVASGREKEAADGVAQILPTQAPEAILQSGLLKLSRRDYPGARDDAEQLLRRDPESVPAARILIESYRRQDHFETGLVRLREVVAARPRSVHLQFLLATQELAAGHVSLAQRALEAAKAADPKFSAADMALSEIEVRQNQPDAARARLAGVVASDPKNPAALVQLAGLEFRAGDRPGAIAHMRAALAIDDRNVAVLNNLAYYLSDDDPDGALKYAEQAAEASPDNPGIQDTLGWIYYRKGLYRNAVPHLKSAVSTQPTPQREFHLALCYLKLGDREVGQNLLHSAISKDPGLQRELVENR